MTQVSTSPTTVGQLEARLRKLIPRLGPRDRQSVLLAIEAIEDLSWRLHKAEQLGKQTTVNFERPSMSVSTRPPCPHCGTPLSGHVEPDGTTVCPQCGVYSGARREAR